MVESKRVLVIYTGGTFGMLKNEKGGKFFFYAYLCFLECLGLNKYKKINKLGPWLYNNNMVVFYKM